MILPSVSSVIFPLVGLVDAHTHPVWEGDRVHEFAMKVRTNLYLLRCCMLKNSQCFVKYNSDLFLFIYVHAKIKILSINKSVKFETVLTIYEKCASEHSI